MSMTSGAAGLPEITESYESIEQLVMETPRGRWFLNEFARRQRSKELAVILDSIARLEKSLNWREAAAATDQAASRITKAADTPPKDENLEARHLKYFKKDEDLFAPAPPVGPRAVDPPEPEKKGARLVVRHTGSGVPADPFDFPTAPAAQPAMKAATADETPKRRIVIIRHKAGEEMDVPLQNELAPAS